MGIGDIVIYKEQPYIIKGETVSGKAWVMRNAHKEWAVVIKDFVKPYEGKEDAVALGLKDAE